MVLRPDDGAGRAGYDHCDANQIGPPSSADARGLSDCRVLKVGISSDSMSLTDMSMTAFYTIRPRLLRVPGVANVAVWGMRADTLQVQVDPLRSQQESVTLDQVMEVAADSAQRGMLQFSEGTVVAQVVSSRPPHRGYWSITRCPSSPRPTWPRYR